MLVKIRFWSNAQKFKQGRNINDFGRNIEDFGLNIKDFGSNLKNFEVNLITIYWSKSHILVDTYFRQNLKYWSQNLEDFDQKLEDYDLNIIYFGGNQRICRNLKMCR